MTNIYKIKTQDANIQFTTDSDSILTATNEIVEGDAKIGILEKDELTFTHKGEDFVNKVERVVDNG